MPIAKPKLQQGGQATLDLGIESRAEELGSDTIYFRIIVSDPFFVKRANGSMPLGAYPQNG